MFGAISRPARIVAILALGLATSFSVIDDAEARRAGGGFGGFGSRGTRTFQAPPVTRTAPTQAAPIERSMTPRPQSTQPMAAQPQAGMSRSGFFNGFGRSMIGGLLAGGLLGMLLGHGFGGGFGMLGMLLQIALIFGAVMLAMRFFAGRRPSPYPAAGPDTFHHEEEPRRPGFQIPAIGGAATARKSSGATDEIGVSPQDLAQFERLLSEVQTAYGAEDYGALRRLTTPEAMSYLAEELGENATNGVRNSVSDVHLLQGDVAEAWREGNTTYATVGMRYSSIDAMIDRTTGRVVSGDDRNASETTEVWTFVRKPGSDWKLTAIQAA